MIDTMTLADATADSLALSRQAMMERCGITVESNRLQDSITKEIETYHIVFQDDAVVAAGEQSDTADDDPNGTSEIHAMP